MTRILARAGRLEAPLDLTLDPSKATRAGGFLPSRDARPRARATTLPGYRTGIGDFGPLLYYRADDATIAAGVMTVPNRTGLSADLVSSGTAPTLATFMPGDAIHGSTLSIVFAALADTKLRTRELDAFLTDNLAGDLEIVMTVCMTSVAAGPTMLIGNMEDAGAPVAGTMNLYTNGTSTISAARFDAAGNPELADMAPLQINVVRILHLVVQRAGVGAARVVTYVNGVPSCVLPAPTGGGAAWAGELCLGADDSGGLFAPGMRVRDVAVYSRALTRDERMAMYSGAFAENPSIPERPRLEDVIDLSGVAFRTFHPDRAPRVVANVLAEADGFDNVGTTTTGKTASGRRYVTLDGATSGLSDQEPGFVTTPADSITLVGCARYTNLGAFGAWLEGYAIAPPMPALSYAAIACDDVGGLRAVYGAANFYLAALGDITNLNATGILVGAPGTGTFYGATWGIGDGGYDTAEETVAAGGVPAGTTDIEIGNIRAAPLPFGGDIFGGALIHRALTANEITAVRQFFFQEFND